MIQSKVGSDLDSPLISKRQHQQETNQLSTMRNNQKNPLDKVTLRELREKNKQTQMAIKNVKSKINYMKNKEEKAVKKVLNVRRKLQSLEDVRSKTRQMKQQSIDEKRRSEEVLEQKSEFNKLIKDHLNYNKKIVTTLLNNKIQEDVRSFKEKKQQIDMLYHIQKDNMNEENAEKANKVRTGHIQAHQRRKMYFLERLKQFKDLKERKLQDQVRERQRQQMMIMELEEKERALLQRLSVSQKFRMKCQQQYQDARRKYHSFYQAARGASRQDTSLSESKADIFIS